jgi:polysaccharide deacetylase family protein (PEP-CTERM system associated)
VTERPAANLLTFDTEEWYHANYDDIDPAALRGRGSNFPAQVDEILSMCAADGAKATFFVLGAVAEDHPAVIRAIAAAGHEIASHGYGHELAYRQTLAEFTADVQRSKTILEDVAGAAVRGYRAPSWSIVAANRHYLAALEELGLVYDASIFPVRTFLYGIPDAPTHIHHPVVAGRSLSLWEVPTSVVRLAGRNIGYSGGFYFRLFPGFFIEHAIRRANRRGRPAIVYLHPREIDPGERRLALPVKEAFIHYHGIGGTRAKLAALLRTFSFTSVIDHLRTLDPSISE